MDRFSALCLEVLLTAQRFYGRTRLISLEASVMYDSKGSCVCVKAQHPHAALPHVSIASLEAGTIS